MLDIDVTDDPLHGDQEGKFYHGYYKEYCYAPSYIFCGRHLLGCRLREANQDSAAGAADEIQRIVSRIRERWNKTQIIIRGDSGVGPFFEMFRLAHNPPPARPGFPGTVAEAFKSPHCFSGFPALRMRLADFLADSFSSEPLAKSLGKLAA